MIRPFIAAVAGFGLVLAAQGAHAAQVQIKHDDLDLTTVAGQKELDKRIERAARYVCTAPVETGSRVGQLDRECFAKAVSTARQQMAMATPPAATR